MVYRHQALARSIARRFADRGEGLDDLVPNSLISGTAAVLPGAASVIAGNLSGLISVGQGVVSTVLGYEARTQEL